MKLSFGYFMKDLHRYRKMMLTALILFAAGVIIGTVGAETIGRWVNPAIQQMQEHSQRLSESPSPEQGFFKFIFLNNAIKSVAVIFLGALFGVYPVLFLVMNGMVIGYLVSELGRQGEDVFHLIFYGLLPHGIIEIPAIIIAAGFGMQFGYMVLKWLGELGGAREEREKSVVWRGFLASAVRGAFWIVILLLLAAGIESVITYNLMK
ncbi:hypothetical protein J41TS12_47010 [Paenibacillus antibioticophila]|uniref:Stage II sporulation protein M n=2 Tax=Paenibacillus TaxID=44249 RepID=A0A919Y933_9BACL|nr:MULTISPECIES: stage II sporulation protein M [Paenibacillus]GIO39840.1 hypothetical protein J41TS12_47010 [Paenibacillus antibioticophila]GIO44778.1 hypothetical protein J41TS4_45360 [Paenibacillus apis]